LKLSCSVSRETFYYESIILLSISLQKFEVVCYCGPVQFTRVQLAIGSRQVENFWGFFGEMPIQQGIIITGN
jgi:hypothetical protein